MSDNIDIIVQDTINDIIVNSSTIVETIDIVVEASVEEVTIISNPNDYIININKVIGEQVQSDWDVTIPQDPAYIKNKPTIPDAQVNSDWNATTGVAEILNKPTIPTQVTNTSELINDGADGVHPFITAQDIPAGQVNSDWNATSGVAEILNKPIIPAEQVNSDWNATTGKAEILNKPTIPSISGLATITYVDTQDALKVDKIAGKGLSTNDFTNTLKTKLDGIQSGAEVNVNADWNAVSGDAQILNKPTIPSIAGLATITYVDTQDALKVDKVAGKGLSTNDFTNTLKTKLDGIQDGAEVNVNADWNATSGDAQILNKPTIPTTTAEISDTLNKRYVTDANLTTIGNQSGTNTGDETTATIKSKLGITTLSGSNTGDQDLSGLVPNTRTVNTKALSSDVTLTTADIADSTDKRYVTDANLMTIGNQSGTNTGDNAVNSLYSGLATSKQDTLVSGTNIKTINGNDILGSGDLTISGGGATGGVNAQKFIVSGQYVNQYLVYSSAPTTSTVVANRLYCMPFFPNQTFTSQSLVINVTTLFAGGLAKVLIFSDLNGVPSSKLYESADFDCSTTGNKTASVTFTFTAGTTYWLGFIANNATNVFTHLQQSSVYAFSTSQPFSANTGGFIASTYNSIPSTLGTINYQPGNIPMISIRKA